MAQDCARNGHLETQLLFICEELAVSQGAGLCEAGTVHTYKVTIQ